MGPQKQTDALSSSRSVAAVAKRARSRLSTTAVLVVCTFVIAMIAMNFSPPHAAADLIAANVTAAASVLLSLGVFLWVRAERSPRELQLLGLAYQLVTGLGISLTEVFITYDTSSVVRGVSWACLWIILFPIVVPTTRSKALIGALGTAAMGPTSVALAIAAGLPMVDAQTLVFLFFPNFLSVVLAMVLYQVLHRLRSDATKAEELGAYALKERLGSGGMGEVWRATHRMLARPAAVKLISEQGPRLSADALERFEREAQATALLTSPHTVHIYDFGVTQAGSPYYAMELLEGRDLQSLVTEVGRVSAARAAHFLRQACESLAEAHDVGIIHRDLKPANLFVCQIGGRTDFLKVLDFGLVAFRADPKDSAISGTPAYLAPEVVSGESADARSDVYALGAIAYFLLTGRTVFDTEGVVAMLHAQVHETPRPPSSRGAGDVPERFEALVLRCLAKEPTQRPKSAQALLAELQEFRELIWTQEEADAWWKAHPLPKPTEENKTDVALLTTYPADSPLR